MTAVVTTAIITILSLAAYLALVMEERDMLRDRVKHVKTWRRF